MSTFRRYGGLNYSSTSNFTRSFISNSDQMNINNFSGLDNTKETFKSDIDMSGNSILQISSLVFTDGSSITTGSTANKYGHGDVDGNKSINYNLLIGFLTKEIQDLKTRVNELEKKLI